MSLSVCLFLNFPVVLDKTLPNSPGLWSVMHSGSAQKSFIYKYAAGETPAGAGRDTMVFHLCFV